MKIIIVGGGTAGWISALVLSKVFYGIHDITVVESSEIKSIGVGEGSTGYLRGIVNNEIWNFGGNTYDFMKFTNATPKLGIFFKDWQFYGSSYIEPTDGSVDTSSTLSDPMLLNCIVNGEDSCLSSVNGNFIKNKKVPFYKNENNVYDSMNSYAYHFDSKLAAKYFENICESFVKKIDSKILDIELHDNGFVKGLILENGQKIMGDFFIDASGFKRIFAKKMNTNFISFKEMTLNSAIPFTLSLDKFSNSTSYTTAWAKKYGWMWMIPKLDSIGCGYIYDDRFIDAEQAKKEIEKDIKVEIDVQREIKFIPGKQEVFWKKNVLSVGLSSNFFEPLEATSIHGTIAQINNFAFSYLKNSFEETINENNIRNYNVSTENMIENFKNLILFHYSKTRSDTQFWINMQKNANDNEFIKNIIKISKNRLLAEHDIPNLAYGSANHLLFNWVVASLGHIDKNQAKKELMNSERIFQLNTSKQKMENFMNDNWETSENFIKFLKNLNGRKL